MATTSNFGWPTPDDSDAVSQGAAAIRALGSAVDATVAIAALSTIVGERNAAPSAGERLSYGNGAADGMFAAPYAGEILKVSAVNHDATTGSTTLQVWKNGTAQGTNYQVTATGTAGTAVAFGTPLAFVEGDLLALECISSTATNGITGTLVIRYG